MFSAQEAMKLTTAGIMSPQTTGRVGNFSFTVGCSGRIVARVRRYEQHGTSLGAPSRALRTC
eukprot:4470227-Prymnesium_polylepis.1